LFYYTHAVDTPRVVVVVVVFVVAWWEDILRAMAIHRRRCRQKRRQKSEGIVVVVVWKNDRFWTARGVHKRRHGEKESRTSVSRTFADAFGVQNAGETVSASGRGEKGRGRRGRRHREAVVSREENFEL